MSIALEQRVVALERLSQSQAAEIQALQEQIRGFTEPPPDIVIPPFPRTLLRMGYKAPDDGSREKVHA